MNEILIKRIKSLAWRVGMMTLAFVLSAIGNNLGMLELSTEATTLIGLVLGEVSKAINSRV